MSRAGEAVSSLRRRWRHAMMKRRAVAELAACSSPELQRMAAEVGLSKADLVQLSCSNPAHLGLLPKRLEQLGVDAEFVNQSELTTYRDLARVCASCQSWRQCARDLARGNVQAGMDDYCLNAETIDTLITADHPPPRR